MSDHLNTADFEFRHHLHDVLILLGCREDIAAKLKKSEDGWVTTGDVDELRQYAIDLIDETKTRLVSLNRLTVSIAEAP